MDQDKMMDNQATKYFPQMAVTECGEISQQLCDSQEMRMEQASINPSPGMDGSYSMWRDCPTMLVASTGI